MSERVRSLLHLQDTASTARVLNLHKVWVRHQGEEKPAVGFFNHPLLDRSILVKHRLRRNETDLFLHPRSAATKVLIPLDPLDIKLGGHTFFIGQQHFERALEHSFGNGFAQTSDFALLQLLDQLPSLDPFLLREHLRQNGRNPDRRYFEVSDADLARMSAFVRKEITPLVRLSFGRVAASEIHINRLVGKILQSDGGDDMEPLRLTLRLEKGEYAEGVFCWKGFLYYKWCLSEISGPIVQVMEEIATIRPKGQLEPETRAAIERGRTVLRRAVRDALAVATKTLKVYDDAYAKLTDASRPTAFREFLLEAPRLFAELGEKLGALNHISSFWRYRFPKDFAEKIAPEDLLDIFADFETSLSFSNTQMDEEAA